MSATINTNILFTNDARFRRNKPIDTSAAQVRKLREREIRRERKKESERVRERGKEIGRER